MPENVHRNGRRLICRTQGDLVLSVSCLLLPTRSPRHLAYPELLEVRVCDHCANERAKFTCHPMGIADCFPSTLRVPDNNTDNLNQREVKTCGQFGMIRSPGWYFWIYSFVELEPRHHAFGPLKASTLVAHGIITDVHNHHQSNLNHRITPKGTLNTFLVSSLPSSPA